MPVQINSPVIVLLHGKGGTAEWALEETCMAEPARAAGFSLLVPDGLPMDRNQSPKFFSNPQIWNSDPDHAEDRPDDVRFIESLFDQLGISSAFVTGFSNGGGMAFRLALELSHRLKAIAPVANFPKFDAGRLARAIPTLILIGSLDPLMPLEGGEVRSPWGVKADLPAIRPKLERWNARVKELDPACPAEMAVIPGLGHHWPGGMGRLNPRIFGPALKEPAANGIILEFFDRFT